MKISISFKFSNAKNMFEIEVQEVTMKIKEIECYLQKQ